MNTPEHFEPPGWHKVEPGETLPYIAYRFRFGDWKTIYQHPDNEDFRRAHQDPNILTPGASIWIPALVPASQPVRTGTWNRFILPIPTVEVVIYLALDKGGAKGWRWKLDLPEDPQQGETRDNGKIRLRIPLDRHHVDLELCAPGQKEPVRVTLDVGYLEPPTQEAGVQARLVQLGFLLKGDSLRDGIVAFQETVGLSVTGEIDDETRNKLAEMHDRDKSGDA